MLLPHLFLLQLQSAALDGGTYNGRANELQVRVPAIEADVVIDGQLDEPVWRRAALLTGFSLYQPIDQRPAPDSTQVLVWYSHDAIFFGIRAFEPHGSVRATLSDRDQVGNDDNVEIHLDTFDERRRAYVFIVNPLGVQADGIKNEGSAYFAPGQPVAQGQNDLSPDFIWQSKGHVTDWGFEVEVRIPFKSMRFPAPSASGENWGLQIVRNVAHSGYQETWTPVRKASASFIRQEGTLVDMRGMQHGQVFELNPELTTSIVGAPATAGPPSYASAPGWQYTTSPTLGGNVKWGIQSNFVLNGTVKPDFSQVEADALQIAGDARFRVFYAEKRPFFVDGIEQFNVPNTLVYTRQIVHPTAAAKLFGRIGRSDMAVLSAFDDPQTSISGGHSPAWNIVRLKRDFAEQSFGGVLLTSREDGPSFNRLIEGDVRHIFGGLYFMEFQAVGSATRVNDTTRTAPGWQAAVDRTGRSFGFHYQLTGIGPSFQAASGFVPRTNFVQANVFNRSTWYGRPGASFEQWNTFYQLSSLSLYDDFFAARSLLEDHAAIATTFTWHGGWKLGLTPTLSSYGFDRATYAGAYVQSGPSFVSFLPSGRITTFTLSTTANTPQFQHFVGSLAAVAGNDVDFFETSRVRRLDYSAVVDWRPSAQLRVDASYLSSQFTRRSDDQVSTTTRIPRFKLEYQLARPLFVRFVGQYNSQTGTALLDPRTGLPIYTLSSGSYVPLSHRQGNTFRVDWLVSYRPSPGTVFFVGYGSSLTEDTPLRFDHLHRATDGFFAKASYLFRG